MVFKHKYITTPTVTPEDAVVAAVKELHKTLKGYVPPPIAKSGIDQIKELTKIFDHTKEAPADCKAAIQKDNKEKGTHSPRVKEEQNEPRRMSSSRAKMHEENKVSEPQLVVALQIVASPTEKMPIPHQQEPRYITQDKEDTAPAHNTRLRTFERKTTNRIITDEIILSCFEISNTKLSARQAASRSFPLVLLCKLAGAVPDSTTGWNTMMTIAALCRPEKK